MLLRKEIENTVSEEKITQKFNSVTTCAEFQDLTKIINNESGLILCFGKSECYFPNNVAKDIRDRIYAHANLKLKNNLSKNPRK
jgi:thioredoxin-related protein